MESVVVALSGTMKFPRLITYHCPLLMLFLPTILILLYLTPNKLNSVIMGDLYRQCFFRLTHMLISFLKFASSAYFILCSILFLKYMKNSISKVCRYQQSNSVFLFLKMALFQPHF